MIGDSNKQTEKKLLPFIHRYIFIESLPQIRLPNPFMFETWCQRFLKFQTMNSVRSNDLSLKYERLNHQIAMI